VSRREFGDDPPFRELLSRRHLETLEESAFFPAAPDPSSSSVPREKPGFSRIASILFGFGNDDARTGQPDRRFDLALQFFEGPEGLRGAFLYDPEAFEAASIQRLRGHFLVLLDACVAAPGQRVGTLSLMASGERERVLVEFNETVREGVKESSVSRLFEGQAERTPEAIAVSFGGDRLTYGELDRRSNRLARALAALGVGPGVLAGICAERSLESVVAVLAVLKSGGAYVALDPEYPAERLEFMLEDSGAAVVLTDERSAKRVGSHAGKTIVLGSESARAMLAGFEETSLVRGAGPEDLAYVIYTSGSTGRPKGVAMPHRALLNLLAWQQEAAVDAGARTLQFASLNFDVSFQEMFSTWCGGGTLVLVSEAVRLSGGWCRRSLSRGCTCPSSRCSIWRRRRSGRDWRRRRRSFAR
jgi:non-ribosomal peptide synthetase component F